MPALLPIRCKTELARQFHRTITNTINVLTEDRNTLTPLETVAYVYTASAAQTTFSGADDNSVTLSYTVGRIEVYVNGLKKNMNEYVATTGSSVVFLTGLTLNAKVIIVKLNILSYPNPSDYYHIFLGRTTAWENDPLTVPTESDSIPPTPKDTRFEDSETKRNILAVKKVQPNDVALMIPKNKWLTNTVYSSYLDTADYSETVFYVTTSSNRIYKCLYSPGSPSTIEPSQITAGIFYTSDGYYWQIMYEIPAAERIKFMTEDYVPVRFYSTSSTFDHNGVIDDIIMTTGGTGYTTPPAVVILGDGVGATATASLTGSAVSSVTVTNAGSGYSFAMAQFVGGAGSGATAEIALRSSDLPITVNQDVASYAISAGGGINFINVTAAGTSYVEASTEISIIGDGTGATATAIVTGGIITSIVITARGKGYTFANVTISGVGANASALAVIEPQGGHGSDVPKELFAQVVAISVNIEDVLEDFFLGNDFRQLGLIKNIKNFTGNELFSLSTGNACYVVGVPNVAQYTVDNIILTGTNGKYIVVNKTSTHIYLKSVIDSGITTSSILQNQTTGIGALGITSVAEPEISTDLGDIIYVRNNIPVSRQSGQTEQVKLYFSF